VTQAAVAGLTVAGMVGAGVAVELVDGAVEVLERPVLEVEQAAAGRAVGRWALEDQDLAEAAAERVQDLGDVRGVVEHRGLGRLDREFDRLSRARCLY
jgi:hypothetical protein